MKENTKEKIYNVLEKVHDLCDSGKPWYFFLGMWAVVLVLDVICQLFSEKKPKLWCWLMAAMGIVNCILNLTICRLNREMKAAEVDL